MISFDEFLKQDEADKYNMLLECNAIIQQKENIIKEVREWIRIVQTNEDKKHFEPIINTDELDYILEILDKVGDIK